MEKIEKFLVIEVDYGVLLLKEECNYVSRLEGFGKKRIGYIYCQYIITSKLRGFLVFNALLLKNYKIKGRKTSDIEIFYKNNKKSEKVKRLVVKNAKKKIY